MWVGSKHRSLQKIFVWYLSFLFFIFYHHIVFTTQELPKEKWFCCDDCSRIYVALQTSVSAGADTIPTPLSELIIRKHKERGLCTYGFMNGIQWRILSGKSRYPEHLPLLSRAAAIFRVSVYCYSFTYDFDSLLHMWLLFLYFCLRKSVFLGFAYIILPPSFIIRPTFEISLSLTIIFCKLWLAIVISFKKNTHILIYGGFSTSVVK